MLFREGAASAGVFRLRSGCVRLIRTTLTGGQATMHTVRQGEFFAEASLFSAIYHCDAVALESSEVLVFRKQALVDQLRKSPELLWTIHGRVGTARSRTSDQAGDKADALSRGADSAIHRTSL